MPCYPPNLAGIASKGTTVGIQLLSEYGVVRSGNCKALISSSAYMEAQWQLLYYHHLFKRLQ